MKANKHIKVVVLEKILAKKRADRKDVDINKYGHPCCM